MTTEEIRDMAVDYLLALGDSPAAVADTMARNAIKGERRAAPRCPAANYLRKMLADYCLAVSVLGSRASVFLSAPPVPAGRVRHRTHPHVTVPLPKAVNDFVMAFDRGEYPSLDSEFQGFGASFATKRDPLWANALAETERVKLQHVPPVYLPLLMEDGSATWFERDPVLAEKIAKIAPVVKPPAHVQAGGRAERRQWRAAAVGLVHVDVVNENGAIEHLTLPSAVVPLQAPPADDDCDQPTVVQGGLGTGQ